MSSIMGIEVQDMPRLHQTPGLQNDVIIRPAGTGKLSLFLQSFSYPRVMGFQFCAGLGGI